MNWKEFLKPDWRRALLTIVFCGVFYGLIYCFFTGSECLFRIGLSLLLGGPGATFEGLLDLFMIVGGPITEKILAVVIAYLLSCIIIWVYDRRKK